MSTKSRTTIREPQFKDNQFIEELEKLGFAGSADIAKRVGCSTTTAKRRLRALAKSDSRVDEIERSTGWLFVFKG